MQRLVERGSLPHLSNRLFGHFSIAGTQPFLDPADFSWTALLEEHYPAISQEAERVLKVRAALPNFQDVAPDWSGLAATTSGRPSGSPATASGTTPTACAVHTRRRFYGRSQV